MNGNEEKRNCIKEGCANVDNLCGKQAVKLNALRNYVDGVNKSLGGRITFTQVLYGGVIAVVLIVGGAVLGYSNSVSGELSAHKQSNAKQLENKSGKIANLKEIAIQQRAVNTKILEGLDAIKSEVTKIRTKMDIYHPD